MGLERLTVLEIAPDADPLPALTAHALATAPDLILCGAQGDVGEASGFLPYALAQAIAAPIAPGICGVTFEARQARLVQALPRGRRRSLAVIPPLVATVGPGAPDPRPSAFARARRGRLEVIPDIAGGPQPPRGEIRPARQRPKALAGASGLTGEARLQALLEGPNRGGGVVEGLAAADAADRLLAYLVREGVIPEPRKGSDP
jgi:electron transfer flavoprotein beta subunit